MHGLQFSVVGETGKNLEKLKEHQYAARKMDDKNGISAATCMEKVT